MNSTYFTNLDFGVSTVKHYKESLGEQVTTFARTLQKPETVKINKFQKVICFNIFMFVNFVQKDRDDK